MDKKVLPTLFALDYATFKNKLEITSKFTDELHIDICDGKFVPTRTVLLSEMKNLIEEYREVKFEVHLMVDKPLNKLDLLFELGIKKVLIHFESFDDTYHLTETIKYFEFRGIEVAVVLNPDTHIDEIIPIASKLHEVMLMSVFPGKEGQIFIEETYSRIRKLRSINPSIIIKVDGGITNRNIKKLFDAGASKFCIGSYITSSKTPEKNYDKLNFTL